MEKETDVEFLRQLKDIESKITKGEWFWDGGDLLSNDGRSYDLLIITAKYVVQDSNMKGIVALRNGFKRLLSLAEAGRQAWVPVSERLPELGIDVDVADEFSTDVDVLTRVDQGNVFWECGHQNGWDYWKPRPAPPSAPVLPEPWGPANRKGEYQVIDAVLPEPNSFQKLRKVMALSEIYYDTPGKIADAATTRIRHLEAKPDAVLPEGQPQKGHK